MHCKYVNFETENVKIIFIWKKVHRIIILEVI